MKIDKAKIGFKAIAVVAAINLKGRVIALLVKEKSIITSDFVEFLKKIRQRMYKAKTYVFLDNLNIHHTNIIKAES